MDGLATTFINSRAAANGPVSVQSVDQASAVYMFQCTGMFRDECQMY